MRQRILAGVVLGLTAVSSSIAAPISGHGTWETTLQGRLPLTPGGTDYQAYYDTDLNITWTADTNLSATNTFGVAGIGTGGTMTWNQATEWIAAMNTAAYLGVSGWRLPNVIDTDGPDPDALGDDGCDDALSGTDCGYNVDPATGEMAHLFHSTLGNVSVWDATGNIPAGCMPEGSWTAQMCLTNTGPFVNLQPVIYWSGTTNAHYPGQAWIFGFDIGMQTGTPKVWSGGHAWAVRDGDIAPVPVPAALWLFGGALGALGWVKRRQAGV